MKNTVLLSLYFNMCLYSQKKHPDFSGTVIVVSLQLFVIKILRNFK